MGGIISMNMIPHSTTKLLTTQKPEIINKPDDKFETMLFLPPGENRKGEGGLRTKGYFKHSYKLVDGVWYICDTDGNPAYPAPESIQNLINEYINKNKANFKDNSTITNLPLISVITAVYNGEKYLEETILSVINQTYPNVEYIIIDGGSTDGTLDIIKKYEDKIDYWISEKDKGIYDAWNKGVTVAMGEWISFLGCGDTYVKDGLKLYYDYMSSNKQTFKYISSKVCWVDSYGKIKRIIGKEWKWDLFKKYMCTAHVGSLHNRALFKSYGLFDENYKIAGDYEFLLRAKGNLKAGYFPVVTANMLLGGVSQTNSLVLYETLFAKLKHSDESKLLQYIQFIVAFLKFKIRKILRLYE